MLKEMRHLARLSEHKYLNQPMAKPYHKNITKKIIANSGSFNNGNFEKKTLGLETGDTSKPCLLYNSICEKNRVTTFWLNTLDLLTCLCNLSQMSTTHVYSYPYPDPNH